MTHHVQISFHKMPPSPAADEVIRERVTWLDTVYDRIRACRVVVDMPHRRHHQGRKFQIKIEIDVPGATLTVTRDAGFDGSHENVYVAIRDAFEAARRRLESYARKRHGDVKHYPQMHHV